LPSSTKRLSIRSSFAESSLAVIIALLQKSENKRNDKEERKEIILSQR
jgi:hypothetical protein